MAGRRKLRTPREPRREGWDKGCQFTMRTMDVSEHADRREIMAAANEWRREGILCLHTQCDMTSCRPATGTVRLPPRAAKAAQREKEKPKERRRAKEKPKAKARAIAKASPMQKAKQMAEAKATREESPRARRASRKALSGGTELLKARNIDSFVFSLLLDQKHLSVRHCVKSAC